MPLADFDLVAEMKLGGIAPCPFEAKLTAPSSGSCSGSGPSEPATNICGEIQFSGPAFSLEDSLPKFPSPILPGVMRIAYEVLSLVIKRAETKSVEPNLLFEVVWYALDLIYDPILYLDALPSDLALILFQLHFQNLAPYEYGNELGPAIAFALGLDSEWNCGMYEAAGSVLMMSTDPETLSQPTKDEWADSDFAILRRALSLPAQFYPMIIQGFREGQDYEQVLSRAENQARGKGPPSVLAQSILERLHDGELNAVCGSLVVQMRFESDPDEPTIADRRASAVVDLLQQDSPLQELVMVVAAFHLPQRNDIRDLF